MCLFSDISWKSEESKYFSCCSKTFGERTFVAVGTLLPAVPLLLPGRVRTGVRHLLAETHVLRLDGSQVLGLRVLGLRPAVAGGGGGGALLDADTDHPGVGVVVAHRHLLLWLDGHQGGRGRGDSSRVTAGQV